MNKKFVVMTLAFAAGVVTGFIVAQFIEIDRGEQKKEDTRVYANDIQKNLPVEKPAEVDPAETESPKDDDPSELISRGPAHIARPGQNGVDYTKVQKIVAENGYTDPDDIKAVIEDPDNEETYEERIEREELERSEAMAEYKAKNKGKIVPISEDEWDTDFPETDYERADLHYFQGDDKMTDDDGGYINEEEYIGKKPRQFGWMHNDEERIYIRNHPKEMDFQVWKHETSSTDWWA